MKQTYAAVAVGALVAAPALAAENRIDLIRPDAPELAAHGAHPVGVRQMRFTDPDRIDIINVNETQEPLYDRDITAEIWYPAAEGTAPGGTYTVRLRDGQTEVTLQGRAARDATPAAQGQFPLVVISHGYPGNRFLLSHLGENLASKGYVAVALDHPDSTYADQGAFGSTLYNRALDQRFAIDAMATLDDTAPALAGITDTDTVAVLGYSMGGYGALVLGGAGVTEASTEYEWGTPNGLLRRHMAGSDSHEALIDPRVKALIAIGPWGYNTGFWDAEGLDGLRVPTLMMAGSADDVSQYPAIRAIFEQARGTTRHLLTFEGANHNAAAPIPAPSESWAEVDTLDFAPFEHYADAVWDSVRMNNIAQHFATAFLDLHLKGDRDKARYLDLIERAAEGVHDLGEDGTPGDDHSYWAGFAPRTAKALRFETLQAD